MKQIKYNRDSKDFDMYLDGRYIGSRGTHREAEEALDEAAFEVAKRQQADAEDAARQAAEDAALAAYTAERSEYNIFYDAGDYAIAYNDEIIDRAPSYSDADAIIAAHIARRQADERRQAEWSERIHHGA